jgi:hypothetical protein
MAKSMNADVLKKVINYDSQIIQFAIGMHSEASQLNEEWTKLSVELIDFANKFGRFVHQQREEGFKIEPVAS